MVRCLLPPSRGCTSRQLLIVVWAIYARASLLDWTIDPLADWIDADAAPENAAEVRRESNRRASRPTRCTKRSMGERRQPIGVDGGPAYGG